MEKTVDTIIQRRLGIKPNTMPCQDHPSGDNLARILHVQIIQARTIILPEREKAKGAKARAKGKVTPRAIRMPRRVLRFLLLPMIGTSIAENSLNALGGPRTRTVTGHVTDTMRAAKKRKNTFNDITNLSTRKRLRLRGRSRLLETTAKTRDLSGSWEAQGARNVVNVLNLAIAERMLQQFCLFSKRVLYENPL